MHEHGSESDAQMRPLGFMHSIFEKKKKREKKNEASLAHD
jgi:hypothetical protein